MSMVGDDFYLVLGLGGHHKDQLMATIKRKPPKLGANEIAAKLNITVPKALFSKPSLTCNVTIPMSEVYDKKIDAEVQNAVKQNLEQTLNVDVSVRVVHPDDEDNN